LSGALARDVESEILDDGIVSHLQDDPVVLVQATLVTHQLSDL